MKAFTGNKTPAFFLFLLVILGFMHPISAQETGEAPVLYRITTTDGNEYIGEILEENEAFILLMTQRLGQITINKKDIRSIVQLDTKKQVGGEYWLDNPQATRYLFAPNGYGLKKGEGYYQNVWIFVNQLSVGVTNNFSIGAGTVPLFLFGGASSPVWIIPKFSVPVVADKFNLGAGAVIGTVLVEENSSFGFLYGLGTLGSRDRNASLGLGYGYAGGDWGSTPLVNFSAMWRVGKNGYLLTENYFVSNREDTNAMLLLGGRTIIRRIGLDYAGIVPILPDMDTFIILPWLGLTVPFGKAR